MSTPADDTLYHSLARIILLEEGLQALTIGAIVPTADLNPGLALPGVHVSPWPSDDYDLAEIVASSSDVAGWVAAEGGTVVVKVPRGGSVVAVTTYGIAGKAALPRLHIQRLDQLVPEHNKMVPAAIPKQQSSREIPAEMIVHIERRGDVRLQAGDWAGEPGQRLRVEGFSIHPLQTIETTDIEYMAFGQDGRPTPWVTASRLCGSRGRGLPLTGFAIRLAPHLRQRFDVVYEGSFFRSGTSDPSQNGEPCASSPRDDPLEAIRFRIIERING